ncbi:putative transmembrane 4 superfamily member [Schistosoma mansoni]|uniref:Putative transmembrane 4 superfamily member n=1 Tax=Schistosoma mansoni TaxID=6183 RepID=G4VFD9_SCHMA|nr:putative transmembrane 4 superfamily member [Schistosoma mansoni]|eukprot:XP_018651257.1 putative transmembrane 4 superfamily member [Schistosoma mansoni]
MALSFRSSKYLLITLNLLYLVIAFILVGVAAYARLSIYVTSVHIVGGIIACGVFLFVLAVAGLLGAIKHNQPILFFYIILLFGLFLVQFSVACACLSLSSDYQQILVETAWKQSSNNSKLTVMTAFKCCGFSRSDLSSSAALGYPPCKLAKLSCCDTPEGETAKCCQGSDVGNSTFCPCTTACWTVIQERLSTGVRVTGATSLFFSVIELLGVWTALRYRHQRDPLLDPNSVL